MFGFLFSLIAFILIIMGIVRRDVYLIAVGIALYVLRSMFFSDFTNSGCICSQKPGSQIVECSCPNYTPTPRPNEKPCVCEQIPGSELTMCKCGQVKPVSDGYRSRFRGRPRLPTINSIILNQ